MKHSDDQWKAAVKKAAADLPACGASDSIVGAVASLRILRDHYGFPAAQANEAIKECCADPGKLRGFLSNASGAAAYAGLKAEKAKLTALTS